MAGAGSRPDLREGNRLRSEAELTSCTSSPQRTDDETLALVARCAAMTEVLSEADPIDKRRSMQNLESG